MNLKWRRRLVARRLLPLLAFTLVAVGSPRAQEPAEAEGAGSPEPAQSSLIFELEDWIAQPVGLQNFPATVADPTNPLGTELLETDHGTESRPRARVGYRLPGNRGMISATYYSQTNDSDLARFQPGDFVFGELLTHPLFAGFGNDGLADAFQSTTQTQLRDWRIDYRRRAFDTPTASGEWFVGWRRVTHDRMLDATYHALVPGLPPLIPPLTSPRPDLMPLPDSATIRSRFDGRGVAAGLDIAFPLWKDKLQFEGGAGLAVLRGDTEASYFAINHVYVLNNATLALDNVILGPPYDEFQQIVPHPDPTLPPIALIGSITQQSVTIGLTAQAIAGSSQVLEGNAGFRWKIHRRVEAFAGIRMTRYTDVGIDLRPKVTAVTILSDGTLNANLEEVTQVSRSVTYEGFYFGVTAHFF